MVLFNNQASIVKYTIKVRAAMDPWFQMPSRSTGRGFLVLDESYTTTISRWCPLQFNTIFIICLMRYETLMCLYLVLAVCSPPISRIDTVSGSGMREWVTGVVLRRSHPIRR